MKSNIKFFKDESDTFAALGEELLAGFFEDDTPKKPAVVTPAAVVPAVVQAVVAETPVVAPAVPAKAPVAVLTNEVEPTTVNEAPLSVVPVETIVPTGEKLAEQVADPESNTMVAETANEIIPVVEGEVLETAASEIVASEVPVAVTQTVSVPESPIAAVASTPVKQTSEEEEGLIEGIVNTLISDDDTDGNTKTVTII